MEINNDLEYKNITISELVADDYRKAEILKRYGIDFCCGGKKLLAEVCEEKGIDIFEIKEKLNSAGSTSDVTSQNFNNWDIDFLIDYIVNTHHVYVKSAIPIIREYSAKVTENHGTKHPELNQISEKFSDMSYELTDHMKKEEDILFPFVKKLLQAEDKGENFQYLLLASAQGPMAVMEEEHEQAGDTLKQLRELTNNYTPPKDACNTFRVFYSALSEYEDDLHKHIHLENNILFPKVRSLEAKLRESDLS